MLFILKVVGYIWESVNSSFWKKKKKKFEIVYSAKSQSSLKKQ